jgi:hypothetical protein
MRGRRGGILGAAVSPSAFGAFSGLWRASEIYAARVGFSWPSKSLTASVSPSFVDATITGEASFSAFVSSSYASYSSVWQKSTDGGQTWSNVSDTEDETTLAITGLTIANDEDLYRFLAEAGLNRQAVAGPVEIRFDTISISFWSQPTNASSGIGQSASFFAGAAATGDKYSGFFSISYQWQELIGGDWVDVQGETFSSFSVPNNEASDEGRTFRVVASAGDETLASDSVEVVF